LTLPDAIDPLTLALALRRSILRTARRLRQETQAQDVSENDLMLLGQIGRNPGVGVSGLAELEGTTQPTISTQVKRLEAAGFVARAADLEDARRSGLSLTALGAKRLDAIRRRRTDWLAKRLAALSPEERAHLAEAATALQHLADTP
jgi:DNA-binding MarR family transcriptional regulator